MIPTSFFRQDVLTVAPGLLGKIIVRKWEDGRIEKFRITETEAYRGMEDLACHAAKGRTKRTEVMFHAGGKLYVYLIYGMYWLLNIVTGNEDDPQAVLIRSCESVSDAGKPVLYCGPGRVGKILQLDAKFYGELLPSPPIWIEDDGIVNKYKTTPRIGIDYAGEWKDKEWRFVGIFEREEAKTRKR